jgi:hypothetical protein
MSVFGSSNQPPQTSTWRSPRETTNIVLDPSMGRCLVASVDLQPGEVIFSERAFIFATYDGRNPFEAELIHHSFPRIIVDRLPDILDDLSNLPRVQSQDTAKNFILLLALMKLRWLSSQADNGNHSAVLMKYFHHMGLSTSEQVHESFSLFDQLSGANMVECIADIRSIKQDYPKLIPTEIMSLEQAAKLLAIVTTNQLELEEVGGSGLFVYTAILQHDCAANCSYSSEGAQIFMTAIRPIEAGTRLSIDYLNGFYTPTSERIESLQETYGFRCVCSLCVGPDRKRAYRCQHCASGLFYAIGSYAITDAAPEPTCTTCQQCHTLATPAHLQRCVEREQQVLLTAPTALDQYEQSCAEGLLHPTHYAYFAALDELYLRLSGEGRSCFFETFGAGIGNDKALGCFAEALKVLRVCISLLEQMLPQIHHEKVVYLDRLGQLAVAIGDAALAKEAYNGAYQQSILSCGLDVPATLAVKALATQPPANMSELLEHYRSKEPTAADDWEDMDEDA